MIFSTDNFNINYTHESQAFIDLLSQTLSDNLERILCFFGLKSLRDKKEIIVYSDLSDYIAHITKYTHRYQDWMIADTFDGNINILSLDNCRKTNSHGNMSYEDYSKVIVHELVHACQQEINENAYGCEWFWEALATNLSGQTTKVIEISCTKEQLMFDYANLPNAYAISYNLGKYMLENMSHEKILEYAAHPELLWNDTEKIMFHNRL